MMVQKRPANESAMKAPMRGVKLEAPPKLVRVLDALTRGRFSTCVRYVIMLAWKPEAANRSHASLAVTKASSDYHEIDGSDTCTCQQVHDITRQSN